ncbi:vitamin K epoxide reductase family protein [Candidatus Woesearchaeota archaeon]|nr:vitamin K epoxide reductase family protein [Candidatus Woesearchaeota archaeon]
MVQVTQAIQWISVLGFLLSAYALWVEYHARKKWSKKPYKALCDLAEQISCTKAFQSPYGRIFGISNGVYGLMVYSLILFLTWSYPLLIVPVSLITVVVSIYLGFISFFRIKNFCLVCMLIYGINVALLILSVSLL